MDSNIRLSRHRTHCGNTQFIESQTVRAAEAIQVAQASLAVEAAEADGAGSGNHLIM